MQNAKYYFPIGAFLSLVVMYLAPLDMSLSLRNFAYAFIIALCGSLSLLFFIRKNISISYWTILPLIAALFLSFSFPLVKDNYPDISIQATGNKNAESKSSEVFVQFNTTDGSRLKISHPGWEQRGNTYVSYQEQPNVITYSGKWANGAFLSFVSHPFSGIAKLKIGDETRTIDLYSATGHSITIPLPEGTVSWKSWLQRISIFISFSLAFVVLFSKTKHQQTTTNRLVGLCIIVAAVSLWYVKDLSYTGDLELVVISGNGTPDRMAFDAGHGITETLTFPVETGNVRTVTFNDSVNFKWNIEVNNGSFTRFKPEQGLQEIEDYCDLSVNNSGCLYQIFGDNPEISISNGKNRYELEEIPPSKKSQKYFVYLSNDNGKLIATSSRAIIYASTWQNFSQWVKAVSISNNNGPYNVLARISALSPDSYKLLSDQNDKGEVFLSPFKYEDTASFIAMKVAFVFINCSFIILCYSLIKIAFSLIRSYRENQRAKVIIAVVAVTGWLVIALAIGWPAVLGWDGFTPYIWAQGGQISLWYGIGYPLIVGGFLLSNFPEMVTLWSFLATSVFLLGSIALLFRYYSGKVAWSGVIWATVYLPLSLIMLAMLTHLRDAINGLMLALFMLGCFIVALYWHKCASHKKIFYCSILIILGFVVALLRIDNIPTLLVIAFGLSLLIFKSRIRPFILIVPIILAWCVVNKVVEPIVIPDRAAAEEQKRLYASTAVMNPLTGMLIYGKDKLEPELYQEIYNNLNKIMDIDYALKNWSPYSVVYWHQTASQRPLPSVEVSKTLTKLYIKSMIKEPILFLHLRFSTFTAMLGQDLFPLPPLPSPQFNLLPGLADHLLATNNPWKQTVEIMGFGPHPHFSNNLMQGLLTWSDRIASSLLQFFICLIAIALFRYNPLSSVIALAVMARCAVFFFFAPSSVYLYLYELQLIGFAMPVMMLVEWKIRRTKEVRNDT
ncbi:hypothetical protein [Atlantibacter hermannii]|uniref:hypothetical protein n=1 Tax=Atlantibacter hermannii TaxID=565 RepID=UPI0022B78479|nr:hypothetical protein [Atlantibacter hermannii]MCZ7834554.1 hypothetical protein [Atlantibacter hermannii]